MKKSSRRPKDHRPRGKYAAIGHKQASVPGQGPAGTPMGRKKLDNQGGPGNKPQRNKKHQKEMVTETIQRTLTWPRKGQAKRQKEGEPGPLGMEVPRGRGKSAPAPPLQFQVQKRIAFSAVEAAGGVGVAGWEPGKKARAPSRNEASQEGPSSGLASTSKAESQAQVERGQLTGPSEAETDAKGRGHPSGPPVVPDFKGAYGYQLVEDVVHNSEAEKAGSKVGDKVMSINDIRERWAINYMMGESYREKHQGQPLVLWVEGEGGLRRIEIPVDQGQRQDTDVRKTMTKQVMGVRWRWVQARCDDRRLSEASEWRSKSKKGGRR